MTGGGYLFFDSDNQQYAGMLQIEIAETIAVKAIGLLTTRMPDGSPGFLASADHHGGRLLRSNWDSASR